MAKNPGVWPGRREIYECRLCMECGLDAGELRAIQFKDETARNQAVEKYFLARSSR
ncbi:MAG: hypothetical protein AB1650_06170 [Candidatus Omnitrophota bacterium]